MLHVHAFIEYVPQRSVAVRQLLYVHICIYINVYYYMPWRNQLWLRNIVVQLSKNFKSNQTLIKIATLHISQICLHVCMSLPRNGNNDSHAKCNWMRRNQFTFFTLPLQLIPNYNVFICFLLCCSCLPCDRQRPPSAIGTCWHSNCHTLLATLSASTRSRHKLKVQVANNSSQLNSTQLHCIELHSTELARRSLNSHTNAVRQLARLAARHATPQASPPRRQPASREPHAISESTRR